MFYIVFLITDTNYFYMKGNMYYTYAPMLNSKCRYSKRNILIFKGNSLNMFSFPGILVFVYYLLT
jgi:hypothetical protein